MEKNGFFHPSDVFPYQPISRRWMMTYIVSSFGFFLQLNRLMKSNEKKRDWLKENILLSFIHALICSILILVGIQRAPEIFQDPLSHSNHFNYALIAFSIGYFCYDFLDCLRNSNTSVLAILAHHIIVIAFLTHVLYHTRNVGYAVYGLSIEMNSIFLHARRLIRWYSPLTNSESLNKFVKIFVEVGNYLTFIFIRFGIVIIGLRALYFQRNRLHPLVHFLTVLSGLSIGTINIILFYRLITNQYRRHLEKKTLIQHEN